MKATADVVIEALNESDVADSVASLTDAISCLEICETLADALANLKEARAAAQALVWSLELLIEGAKS